MKQTQDQVTIVEITDFIGGSIVGPVDGGNAVPGWPFLVFSTSGMLCLVTLDVRHDLKYFGITGLTVHERSGL